jgi:hypothetical protein
LLLENTLPALILFHLVSHFLLEIVAEFLKHVLGLEFAFDDDDLASTGGSNQVIE